MVTSTDLIENKNGNEIERGRGIERGGGDRIRIESVIGSVVIIMIMIMLGKGIKSGRESGT